MKGRILPRVLAIVCAAALLPGCEMLRHNLRPRSDDDTARVDDAKSEESIEAKGFFKSSRLSGAMSSEGREIEQSLGVR
jgi:hypothetical protein